MIPYIDKEASDINQKTGQLENVETSGHSGVLEFVYVLPVLYLPLFKPLQQSVLERVQGEVSLRRDEEHYRAVAEDTHVLILRFLPHGEIYRRMKMSIGYQE